jgi:hypothetical protein
MFVSCRVHFNAPHSIRNPFIKTLQFDISPTKINILEPLAKYQERRQLKYYEGKKLKSNFK